jgi:hypothetical protein
MLTARAELQAAVDEEIRPNGALSSVIRQFQNLAG